MAQTTHTSVKQAALSAREAARELACKSAVERNEFLCALADELVNSAHEISSANQRDIDQARHDNVKSNLIDRLLLDEARIAECADALRELAHQVDPLGEVVDGRTLPSGIQMIQVRVPLGVCAMIYEARPNVTIDAFGIGIKTGNAMLLRGGSLAVYTNKKLGEVFETALRNHYFPEASVCIIDASTRETSRELMELHGLIDVLIPRGGAGLIKTVVENSKVPVIETGTGNCHIYIHKTADLEKARAVTLNAKTQRTSVCNAAESLLVDESIAREALSVVAPSLALAGVELVADEKSSSILKDIGIPCSRATEEDFATEYLDLKMSVKIVANIEEAVDHINTYGTHHSDAIMTETLDAADYFTNRVDSAVVYVNASTRFTDGGMFGLGAEIGISTQKLHARGPMGLTALTTTKYILQGEGQVRQ